MDWRSLDRRARLRFVGLSILVAGLCAAVVIDRTASDEPGPVLGYEMEGGGSRPVNPEDSKQYLRGMEEYGGKTGVLVYELRTWFAGLWRGRALARTIFCLSAGGAGVVFLVARRLPPDPDTPGSDTRDRRD